MTSKRLARLVRLKRLAEQAEAAELADQRRSLDDAKSELQRVHEAMDAAEATLDAGATASELEQVAAYKDHLSLEAKARRADVADKASGVRTQEAEVRTAWRDRRLLETVHGKAADREAVEEAAKGHKAMEAIALRTYGKPE